MKKTNIKSRRPCVGPFTHLGIRWDGQVSACCRDWAAVLNFGNVKDNTLEEIWNSDKLNNLRMLHVKGEFEKEPSCLNCDGQTSPYITDEDIVEYLIDMGREEEILPYLRRVESPLYKEYTNRIKDTIPVAVTLESNSNCNINCIMCIVHDIDVFGPRVMPIENFKKHLKDIASTGYNIEDFRIFFWGEPSIHPHFKEVIQESAKYNPIRNIAFDTNATGITDEMIEVLLDAGEIKPVNILIGCDALSSEVYNKIRVNNIHNSHEKLFNTIKKIYLRRKERNLKYPKIMLQFIVMKENHHESKPFLEYWTKYFNKMDIDFKVIWNGSFAEEDGINFRMLFECIENTAEAQIESNNIFDEVKSQLMVI